jgi:hypothetical protein
MDYKIVASCKLARALIKHGFRVIDIKPDKLEPLRTVFVFENTKEFQNYIKQYDDNKVTM